MIRKFIITIMAIIATIWWLRRTFRQKKTETESPPLNQDSVGTLLPCQNCGVYFSQDEGKIDQVSQQRCCPQCGHPS